MEYLRKLLVLLALTTVAQGHWDWLKEIFRIKDRKPSYIPNDATMEEWYGCHGMPCEEYHRVVHKIETIKEYSALLTGKQYHKESTPQNDGTLDNCIWLTERQADTILLKAKEDVLLMQNRDKWEAQLNNQYGYRYKRDTSSNHHRQKRKIIDFTKFSSKWTSFPIRYTFDGTHSATERQNVRNAFQHWMDNTCLTFQEVPSDPAPDGSYILFTSAAGAGCRSYVGRTIFRPQTINLQYNCFWEFGVPVHEIGHALGLWHEQNRFDRDKYINVTEENLSFLLAGQYRSISDTVSLNVPYDYTSVMHYHPSDGAIDPSKPVIEAVDPLYQSSMGQRTGLSYYDAKIINNEYCKDRCQNTRTPRCQHGGYQDPKDCTRCRCPDGFSGDLCQSISSPVVEDCGSEIRLGPNETRTIMSPSYSSRGFYQDHTECSWLITADRDYRLSLEFVGDFGVYCYNDNCIHWVEVKYKRDKGMYGPRFCCQKTPDANLVSEDNEMSIVFKANWTTHLTRGNRGFQAIVRAVRAAALPPPPPPTPTPKPVPPPVDNERNWMCSLETPRGAFTWCGMQQELDSDQFDWTIQRGPTPSDETGPEGAYNGDFYMYIEASDPRQAGDTAIIYLPTGDRRGNYCLEFYYNMFGFHIRTLSVTSVNDIKLEVVWNQEGQQGMDWRQARVDINIRPGDRIAFVGERGEEFSGDIAVDAISLSQGRC